MQLNAKALTEKIKVRLHPKTLTIEIIDRRTGMVCKAIQAINKVHYYHLYYELTMMFRGERFSLDSLKPLE